MSARSAPRRSSCSCVPVVVLYVRIIVPLSEAVARSCPSKLRLIAATAASCAAMIVVFSLAGGALLADVPVKLTVALLAIAGVVQLAYWAKGDKAFKDGSTNMASATGLGTIGTVRAFEPPHTGTNYLLQEFVYVVARKHALKLRAIVVLLMLIGPMALLALPFHHVLAALAVISHLIGVLASRWLFFAEAEHVVGLYYGKR